MHKYIFRILLLLAVGSSIISCKSSQKTGHKAKNSVDSYSITKVFLDAKRDLIKGKRTSAIEGFERCISVNPKHDASYYELARIYEYQNANKALEYANKAIKIDPNNIWYKEYTIQLYQDQKNYDAALQINKDLIALHPLKKGYYYQRANLYIYKKDNKNAAKTYDRLIEKFGYEQGILEQQKQIYLSNGDFKKAKAVLRELIEHNPKNKDYYGMMAEIYLNEGNTDMAMQYYEKIISIDPNDGYVHFALADYYYAKGESQKSFNELKEGMQTPSLNVDSKMKVLLRIKELSEKDKNITPYFEELLAIATKVHPKEPKILAVNADYNNSVGNTKIAIDYYKQIIAIDSSKYIIWEQLLIAQNSINDSMALLNYSERALHLFPQQASLYFYNGVANADLGNWQIVKQRAKMGLNFIYKKNEKALMLALRAKAEMHLGQIDDGVANYSLAIRMDPQNIVIKRDYAYYLAINKRDLSNALEMAKSALEVDSNNPESIYVYAYCLYQDGQAKEALKWIKPALIKYPNNKQIQLLDMEINKSK